MAPFNRLYRWCNFFSKRENNYELGDVKIEIENYSNVIKSHKAIITTIISYLKEEILGNVQENYNQILELFKQHLNEYLSNLNRVVVPISKLYEVCFQKSLEDFKKEVKKYASNSYSNLYNDLNIISSLEKIEKSLNSESETNLKSLISQAEIALNNVISKYKSNLETLESSVNTFITKSSQSLKGLKNYQKVGIDYYYRAKEIFHKINIIMDSFNDNLANALDSEFLLLQSYVNDNIYMNIINDKINKVEIIWDIFNNNDFLKESVTSGKADEIVSKLETIRKI